MTAAATGPTAGADIQRTDCPVVVMDAARLKEAKERLAAGDPALTPAMDALRREADNWLAQGPFTVTRKTMPPPGGDKHDYLSFGPYWWPDPNREDGLPYVRRDGEVNPRNLGPESDRQALDQMAIGTETLALTWFFTGEQTYAERAALFLDTWFLDPETRMRPHLKHGQAIPGRCEGRGIGIIETRRLVQVVNAVSLLDDAGVLTGERRQALHTWFAEYLRWLRGSRHGREERRQANNHGTWHDVQVASFALFTGRRELAASVLEKARRTRLTDQVAPDGRQPRELTRTRAMTYSLLNVSGLLALAWMGRQVGVEYGDFPSADDRRLRAAAAFLAAYADARKPWPYAQITPLDRAALYPVLRQAAALLDDSGCRLAAARLPRSATMTDRANLLWP